MTRDLAPLVAITGLIYDTDLATLQGITQREARLRDSLSELERRAEAGFLNTLPGGSNLGQAASQERAWRNWLSRHRGELQRELAQVLLEKSEATQALGRSLGRRDIARTLERKQRDKSRAARQAAMTNALQELSLLQRVREDRD